LHLHVVGHLMSVSANDEMIASARRLICESVQSRHDITKSVKL
jgi:hypothetical protein